MSRNEQTGTVTRAFDEWKLVDRDVRAFVRLVDRLLGKEFGNYSALLLCWASEVMWFGDADV
jgi:hypothetical protein